MCDRKMATETAQAETAVFVYGTLKKGFGNHRLLSGAVFLGQAVTEEFYALYVSGIPFVIRDKQVSSIHGEIYLVGQAMLKDLDNLEGHPGWYKREQISVCLQDGKCTNKYIHAWIYFFPKPIGQLQADGIYG